VISQSVPHLHIHVVPRRKGDGLKGFFWPRQPYRDDAHIDEVRRAIVAVIGFKADTKA
jgi:histidine triad (HIT) family protein